MNNRFISRIKTRTTRRRNKREIYTLIKRVDNCIGSAIKAELNDDLDGAYAEVNKAKLIMENVRRKYENFEP